MLIIASFVESGLVQVDELELIPYDQLTQEKACLKFENWRQLRLQLNLEKKSVPKSRVSVFLNDVVSYKVCAELHCTVIESTSFLQKTSVIDWVSRLFSLLREVLVLNLFIRLKKCCQIFLFSVIFWKEAPKKAILEMIAERRLGSWRRVNTLLRPWTKISASKNSRNDCASPWNRVYICKRNIWVHWTSLRTISNKPKRRVCYHRQSNEVSWRHPGDRRTRNRSKEFWRNPEGKLVNNRCLSSAMLSVTPLKKGLRDGFCVKSATNWDFFKTRRMLVIAISNFTAKWQMTKSLAVTSRAARATENLLVSVM